MRLRSLAMMAMGVVFFAPMGWAADGSLTSSYDPTKVLQNEGRECAPCHGESTKAWAQSAHRQTYKELHFRDRTRDILERVGGKRSVRQDRMCAQCHFTQFSDDRASKPKAILGVSCQRCHGPAMDWADVHQDVKLYPNSDERLTMAKERGLRSRLGFYEVARTCYECHTVPKERLVNVGGHHAGSEGFELVEWLYGEVRHSFKQLPERGDNREPDVERRRVVFVLGKLLEIEFGLHGLSLAKEEGPFLEGVVSRFEHARDCLIDLDLGIPEIDAVLAQLSGLEYVGLATSRTSRLKWRWHASRVSELAQAFEKNGADYAVGLSGVDGMLPEQYRGEVFNNVLESISFRGR